MVLPYANMGGDPEQEYFVDGVTESLTTDLSRIRGSFVIGRSTAFTYKGKHVDLKQIGRELNVRYVLEGSIQRGGNWMRVNVQLIDGESGNHVWAERFDKSFADLFDLQDEIIARLANAVSSQLYVAEARRAERTLNPDAVDLCFQGLAWLNKGLRPEYLTRAREFFERTLALDPVNVSGPDLRCHRRYVDCAEFVFGRSRRATRPPPKQRSPKCCPWPLRLLPLICYWAWSKCILGERLRASGPVSARCNWIEIWRPHMRT